MYFVVLLVIFSYFNCGHFYEMTKLGGLVEIVDEKLIEFAHAYMLDIESHLAENLGQIGLPDLAMEFNGSYISGKAQLTDGIVEGNLNLNYSAGFTKQIFENPKGYRKGRYIHFVYDIPELKFEFNFTAFISSHTISGVVNLIYPNQVLLAKLIAHSGSAGCAYGEEDLTLMLLMEDYRAEFEIYESKGLNETVVEATKLALNTMLVKTATQKINANVFYQITLGNHTDEQEFNKQMKDALCAF